MSYKDYIKWERMPSTWCPGCGIGIVLKYAAMAIDELKIPKEDVVVVSGIGCSGRSAGYFDVESLHGLHGRALAMAEGVKRGNRKLNVVVISGDGDLLGIGGNHLLHTSRRNVEMCVICINNEIYGMTGGQMSPTTKKGTVTLTSPGGSPYNPVNAQGLITSNKDHFYARSSVFHLNHLKKSIQEGISRGGFSFIEVISYCIENNGRRLGFKDAPEMLDFIRKNYKVNPSPEGKLGDLELGIVKT